MADLQYLRMDSIKYGFAKTFYLLIQNASFFFQVEQSNTCLYNKVITIALSTFTSKQNYSLEERERES